MGAMGPGESLLSMTSADYMRHLLPLLNDGRWEFTSEATSEYNCAAWAAGVTDRIWWPEPEAPEYYWPAIRRDGTVEAMIEGFAVVGYLPCDNGDFEPRIEKLAIYVVGEDSPKHVARQLPDGRWTSKIGDLEDIAHTSIRDVAAGRYGYPRFFLSRPYVV